jgi:hypothetical protein
LRRKNKLEEFPSAIIPDTPNWSENFAFAGFDPESGIELFCHIGRWRRDLTLWREIVTIALPDGTVAFHRGIGNARATPRGPGGGNFQIEVVDPDKASMRLRYHGSARLVPEDVLFEDALTDGPHFRLAFDLAFEGVAPKWDISKAGHKTEFMGAGHVEQFGRLTGVIELADQCFKYNTLVNRDHSRGPRVFDSNIRHNWLQGYLEDGTMFQLYEAEIAGKTGPAYSEVNVVENGVAHAGSVTLHDKLPFTDNRRLSKAPSRFTIRYADKVLDVTATESIQSTSPNDMYIGRRQIDDMQNTTVLEQGVRYQTSDGRHGYGHVERLVPGKLLVDPA